MDPSSPHDDPAGDPPADGSSLSRQETVAQVAPSADSNSRDAASAGVWPIQGYDIVREISRGGQGIVYQAVQRSTQRKVALKLLLEGPYASPAARRRFEREVELVSHLKHPNIIAVFDSGTTPDGRLFYVMDYVRGQPVTRYVRDQKLNLQEVLKLFAGICEAVNHAHQKGVIHRDLKPSNILVDADRQIHVLDFGLAKAVTDRHEAVATVTGQLMGTLQYMAPEQTRGNPDLIDTRTDVYALGVILYEMLTGTYPYPVVGEIADVLKHITQTEPTSLMRSWTRDSGIVASARKARPGRCPIDDEVETIVQKALAKEKERRYQGAAELAQDVRHYLAGEAIEAKRDSGLYMLKKTLSRYRAPVAVILLIAVILTASSIIAWTQRNQAVAARESLRLQKIQSDDNARKADLSAAEARTMARLAEQRLAEGLMLAGDSLLKSGRPSAGRDTYLKAMDLSRKLGTPDFPIRVAMLDAYVTGAPPLMGEDGDRKTIGGFSGHTDGITAVAICVDGRTAVSSSVDKTLRVWDIASGMEIRTITGHTGPVQAVAYSPNDQRILSGAEGGELKLWDAAIGEEIRSFAGHTDTVTSVAFSPDGRSAISGSGDKTLKLWDLATGTEVRSFSGHKQWITVAAFSPDGRTILSASGDTTLKLWDTATGVEIRRVGWHFDNVLAAAFAPDGRTCVSGGRDNMVKLWDVATGQEIRRFPGHAGRVHTVAFSPDGRTIISGGDDRTLKLWDAATGREIQSFSEHTGAIRTALFMANSRSILCCSDKTLKFWDLNARRDVRSFWGHAQGVNAAVFSADGYCVLSGSDDKTVKLWDIATGKELRTFSGHTVWVSAVASSPDGRSVLSGSGDKTVRRWDMITGKEMHCYTGHTDEVTALALSPDGRSFLSGSADKTLKLWDLATGNEIRTFSGHTSEVDSVAFSPDGRSIMSGSRGSSFKMWDLATGKEIRTFTGHRGWVAAVGFAPDGRTALSGGYDKTIKLWNLTTGTEIRTLTGHTGEVHDATFSPDGLYILSGGKDATMRLWDVASGQEVHSFAGHLYGVRSVAFAPDSRSLLASGGDTSMTWWDLRRPEQYAEFERLLPVARDALSKNPNDPAALQTFGQWWAFRGRYEWAIDFYERARANGVGLPSLPLARCYWKVNRLPAARREFQVALNRKEAPEPYLRLCLGAVEREEAAAQPAR